VIEKDKNPIGLDLVFGSKTKTEAKPKAKSKAAHWDKV
jgi:hypothetical protein